MNDISPNGPTQPSLQTRSLNSFMWLFSGGALEAVLKILVVSILARILTPADFGIVSAALTVVALADVFGRIGVAPSIVQAPELTEVHVRTAVTATLVSGLLVAALVFLAAEPIANLYGMPGLEDYVRVFSVLFLIRAFSLVSEALLQRRMQFRLLAIASLISYVAGYAAVSIILSWLGFGPWSLIFGQLAQVTIQCVLFNVFAVHSFRPSFDVVAFRHMFRFGAGVTLSQIGNYFALNADYMIIGRFLGADALGFYSRAYLLLFQPAQLVGQMGDKVLFPAMSSIQNSKERLAFAFNTAIGLSALIQVPLSVFVMVLAPEVIHILLGHNWDSSIFPFQLLVSTLFFRTSYKFIGTALRATGRVYILALWQWAYAGMVVVGATGGLWLGLPGVAAGVSMAIVLCFVLGVFIVHRTVDISFRPGAASLLRFTLLSAVLLILIWPTRQLLVSLGLSDLAVFGLTGAVSAFAALGLWTAAPTLFGKEGELLAQYLGKRFKRRGKRKLE